MIQLLTRAVAFRNDCKVFDRIREGETFNYS